MNQHRFSISTKLGELPPATAKRYDLLYKESGFEFGFGRGGAYDGHSHLHFVDVLFSPAGVVWAGLNAPVKLVIAPSRTYLPDVRTGDFAFLKFCPDDREVVLPDKVPQQLHERELVVFGDDGDVSFPWYADPMRPGTIGVSLRGSALTLDFSNETSFLIED
jgi:hypothetical protein